MLKKMVDKAVRQKIGSSRLVEQFNDAYDYIIVGAGAAGNVLANRLSEDGSHSVLLLEAGGDDAKEAAIHMPVSASEIQANPKYNWQYQSEPQSKAAKDLKDQKIFYPRGKGLGGSSSINFMIYVRGSAHDFNEWDEHVGGAGWSYKDVLPYFIKAEANSNPDYLASGYHGKKGPMKIRDLKETPLVTAFLDACQEMNYNICDVNGKDILGVANAQANINSDGIRWSTAHGYLRPAMDRDNLHVAVNSQVKQVLFYNDQATGVEVAKDNKVLQVKARKEVILSAGVMETPKILMLSGIGPQHDLSKFKIPVRVNRPVGYNLQDHPTCMMEYKLDIPPTINVDKTLENPNAKEYQQYMFFSKGYLGMAGPQAALGFFRSPLAPSDRLYPDIQIQMSTTIGSALLKKSWNLKDSVWADLEKHDTGKPGIFLTNLLLHPKSRGMVQLRSTDPFDSPKIDPCFLQHEEDAQVLMEGLKLKLRLGDTHAFKKMGAHLKHRLLPSNIDNPSLINDDEFLMDYVRHQTLTGHHACGTCSMGKASDPAAVVDPELKVIGVQNLRVVDASVMPSPPSGATSTPTIMIAEKAADIILGINSVKDIQLPADVQ